MTTSATFLEISAEAVAESLQWVHDHEGTADSMRYEIEEIITGHVPASTSILFAMVVDDNQLAHIAFEDEADTPFTALFSAIRSEIADQVWDAIRQEERA